MTVTATPGTTTTVHVIGKCPIKGCRNRRRNTCPGQVKSNRMYTWTEWTIPAPTPYGAVQAHLSKRSDRHYGWGTNPRPSQWLANRPHAHDHAWFAAVDAAGWICHDHDRFMVTTEVAGTFNAEKPCTGGCKSATGPNCECVCAGEGHGANWGF